MDHRFKPFTEDWQISPGQVGHNYASNDLRIAFTDDGSIMRRRLAHVRSGQDTPRQVYGLSPNWMYLIPRHVSPWSTKAVSVSTYITSFRRTLWTTISEFGKHYRSGFHHPHTTFRIVYPSAAYVLGRQTTCYRVTWLRTTSFSKTDLSTASSTRLESPKDDRIAVGGVSTRPTPPRFANRMSLT